MAHPSIEHIFYKSPLILAIGGATITLTYALRYGIPYIHITESFLLVWLGYRAFQSTSDHLFQLEKAIALTLLLCCFFAVGFPPYIMLGALITWLYLRQKPFALRSIPWIKNVSIALAWTSCTTAIALAPNGANFHFFLADFCLIFGLSLLSDLRDREVDFNHIRTAVHMHGHTATALFSLTLTLAYVALQHRGDDFSSMTFLYFVVVAVYILILCYLLIRTTHRTATILIDGSISLIAMSILMI